MPDPVFYIRGGVLPAVENLVANDDVLSDLKALTALSDEQVSALQTALAESEGFLDPDTILLKTRAVIDQDDLVQSIQRAIRNLAPKALPQLLKALVERQKEEDIFPLNLPELERLGRILPALIQPYPALTRYKKADRLTKLTGQPLESFELICDLRPIFDEQRIRIEGLMPYTRLRIVATGADGLPNSFEAELTQQQVQVLADKAAKAKDKLNILRDSVEAWIHGGLPNLPLTHVRKDSNDA